MTRTWKQLLILNLSLALFTACGNVPLINSVLGVPGSGAVTDPSQSAGGNINEDSSDSEDPSAQEQDNIENTGDIQNIPGASDTEIVIETDDGVSGTSGTSGGVVNGATTEGSGMGLGEDTTDSAAPGADAPDYFPSTSGPVDIPVSTAKEDGDDGCTADNTGEVMMIVASADTSRELALDDDSSSTDRRSLSRRNTHISFVRAPSVSTPHFALNAEMINPAALPDLADLDGAINGTAQPTKCQEQEDENGEITHIWVEMALDDALTLNILDGYSVVVGHLQETNGHLIQSAVTLPLQADGRFHVDGALLNPANPGFDYIGLLPKNADTNIEPDETLVIQTTPTTVHIDLTNSLSDYIDAGKIFKAPTIRLTHGFK